MHDFNARAAMEFYQTVFGGKLTVSTFKELHASEDPSEDDKVMHAMLQAAKNITGKSLYSSTFRLYPEDTGATNARALTTY
jgi:uncharacterized glyoxalase superfamily protein PhnB